MCQALEQHSIRAITKLNYNMDVRFYYVTTGSCFLDIDKFKLLNVKLTKKIINREAPARYNSYLYIVIYIRIINYSF